MLNAYTLPNITDTEFFKFQKLIYQLAGIHLPITKKMLVAGRLGKRLRHYQLPSYNAYYQLINTPGQDAERQIMVDLLTTNETYFFREAGHFDFLRDNVLAHWPRQKNFRAWSAACSSGEEAYTLAMLLMDKLGETTAWEVLGSDISSRVLETASHGHYPLSAASGIPQDYLRRFCLKGVRAQAGTFLIDKNVRQHVSFRQVNLNESLPALGQFDLILIRNVLIYFNQETKQAILQRILPLLKSGGYCFIGHAESLLGVNSPDIHNSLTLVAPTIYRKR